MLAGGMTIAAPSMMPQAQAAGALYVSAENAMFGNTFGGAQIVEVVVINNNDETDESQAEPTVKVDERLLRMAQGADGAWYGYFGDSTAVAAADEATNNLDFGVDRDPHYATGSWAAASNVWVNATAGVITNPPTLSNYNNTEQTAVFATGGNPAFGIGQIGLIETASNVNAPNEERKDWPLIQTYDFTEDDYTFEVRYEQAGADEVVTLTHDSANLDDYASLTLDRTAASQGSQVHLTITDNQLNIDPTNEDIVIFKVTSGSEGVSFTDNDATATYRAYDNYFDDNGVLIIDYNRNSAANAVLVNDDTLDDTSADNELVFYEYGENSGIFFNTDDNDDSNLEIGSYAKRGTTALFDYNDAAQTLVVANDFGVINMDETSVGDEWRSGRAHV